MCFSTRATTENPLIDGLLMWFKANDCCLLQFSDIPILPRADVILGRYSSSGCRKAKVQVDLILAVSVFKHSHLYNLSRRVGSTQIIKNTKQFGRFQAFLSCPWDPWVKRSKLKTKASHRAFGDIPSAGATLCYAATPAFRPIDDATPPIAWREGTLRERHFSKMTT